MAKHLRIQCGDITTADCDAVVNAWNRNFIPYWLLLPQGVAGALRRTAGKQPFREVSRHGLLPLGAAVATSAGQLKARWIIHVAALHAYWKSSPEAVELGASNAFKIAADVGARTLAMPLLGAGTGGVSPDESFAIIREVWEGSEERPDETLLYVFDPILAERLVVGTDWTAGCAALCEGRFWEAHEHWERVWRLLPESAAREAVQALIQFAAACHKTVQLGAPDAMQRGMAALIESGRAHLDAAHRVPQKPGVRFDLALIRGAFAELDDVQTTWPQPGATACRAIARRLVEEVDQSTSDGPVNFHEAP